MNTPMSQTVYKFPPGYTGQRQPADADHSKGNTFNWYHRADPSKFCSEFRTKDKYNALSNCGMQQDRSNFKFQKVYRNNQDMRSRSFAGDRSMFPHLKKETFGATFL